MFSFSLSLPPRVLSPNARVHWAQKARATKKYRELAFVMALHALGNRPRPKWPVAKAGVTFHFPTRHSRDRDNLLAMMKAAFDGIADAGIVANDAGFIHMPVRVEHDPIRPRVEIAIEPVGGAR